MSSGRGLDSCSRTTALCPLCVGSGAAAFSVLDVSRTRSKHIRLGGGMNRPEADNRSAMSFVENRDELSLARSLTFYLARESNGEIFATNVPQCQRRVVSKERQRRRIMTPRWPAN